ncbi:MAG: hypothetical protein ABL958_13120 [Bdellovibrionia bacterium]
MNRWIHSARFDLAFILGPALFSAAAVLAFPDFFSSQTDLPIWAWVVLVVLVDVAHVYATLYRTYFDPAEFKRRATLYTVTPILVWALACVLYSFGPGIFWRAMAYLAVFHFVRQQYGFMRIYGGSSKVDRSFIYLATLYPLVYWHTHPRTFSWFIEGDFFKLQAPWLERLTAAAYLIAGVCYIIQEFRSREFNAAKNLLALGTAASWYFGIVAYNGDWAFTLTNVVSHGIPYFALIWIYGRKKTERSPGFFTREIFTLRHVPTFLVVLFSLAFLEEAFWDSLIWRDHTSVFAAFSVFPKIEDSWLLSLFVPLLILPQAVHYVLDGFIWKFRDDPDLARLVRRPA